MSPPVKTKPSVPARKASKARAASYSPPPKATSELKDEIWRILNPRKAREAYDYDSDAVDEDSDDMEANYEEIEEENRQADRIARLEDRREMERLERRAKEKEEMKKRKATAR